MSLCQLFAFSSHLCLCSLRWVSPAHISGLFTHYLLQLHLSLSDLSSLSQLSGSPVTFLLAFAFPDFPDTPPTLRSLSLATSSLSLSDLSSLSQLSGSHVTFLLAFAFPDFPDTPPTLRFFLWSEVFFGQKFSLETSFLLYLSRFLNASTCFSAVATSHLRP